MNHGIGIRQQGVVSRGRKVSSSDRVLGFGAPCPRFGSPTPLPWIVVPVSKAVHDVSPGNICDQTIVAQQSTMFQLSLSGEGENTYLKEIVDKIVVVMMIPAGFKFTYFGGKFFPLLFVGDGFRSWHSCSCMYWCDRIFFLIVETVNWQYLFVTCTL